MKVKLKEDAVFNSEKQIKAIEEAKQNLEIKTHDLNRNKEAVKDNKEEQKTMSEEIIKLEDELKGRIDLKIEEVNANKKSFLEKQGVIEENIEKIRMREASFNAVKENSENIISKINSMDKCLVCEQIVSKNHKHAINTREQKTISDLNSSQIKLSELKETRKNELETLFGDENFSLESHGIIENTFLENDLLSLGMKNDDIELTTYGMWSKLKFAQYAIFQKE